MLARFNANRWLFGWLALFLLVSAQVSAGDTDSEQAAIRASVKSYVEAYNRGNVKAVADHWSDEGQWVSPDGEKHTGKEAIAKALAVLFEDGKGVKMTVDDPEIRLVTNDVAVEEGTVHISSPDATPSHSTYQAIHVKQNGKWKLHSVRETEVVEVPAAAGALQDLAWLVGEWVEEDGESTAKVSWTKNKTFLSYSFKILSPDGDDLEGTQVIGWDPANETIRSWMFDSDGGFGEGVWSRRDNTWVVKFRQTLADGRSASATNVYTLSNGNSFTWKSVGRQIDGEFASNVEEVKVVRKAAYEAAQAAASSTAESSAASTVQNEDTTATDPQDK